MSTTDSARPRSPGPLAASPAVARDAAPAASFSRRGIVGDIVCRGAVPLWVAAGAAFKLAERNPNLLPPPVRNRVFELHDLLGIGTTEQFLEFAMRSIIAVEFVLVAGMVFLPRLSRWLALSLLALFIVILSTLVAQGALTCGCFGASGPSPVTVLAIDSALFVLAAVFGPRPLRGNAALFAVTAVVGTGLAFGVPSKSGGSAPADGGSAASSPSPAPVMAPPAPAAPPATAPANDAQAHEAQAPKEGAPSKGAPPADRPSSGDAPAVPPSAAPKSTTPPAAPSGATEWPAPPAKTKGFYAPRFNTWVGKRLSEQEMMLMLKRPLPPGLDQGRWHIVLYRVDCDHCQELINTHFAGKLETKTLLLKVPDAKPGPALRNNATDVVRSEFIRVGEVPDYVIGTPIVLTVVDGVVKAVCEDPAENPDSLAKTLDAK